MELSKFLESFARKLAAPQIECLELLAFLEVGNGFVSNAISTCIVHTYTKVEIGQSDPLTFGKGPDSFSCEVVGGYFTVQLLRESSISLGGSFSLIMMGI